jgi:hypothetical protein
VGHERRQAAGHGTRTRRGRPQAGSDLLNNVAAAAVGLLHEMVLSGLAPSCPFGRLGLSW